MCQWYALAPAWLQCPALSAETEKAEIAQYLPNQVDHRVLTHGSSAPQPNIPALGDGQVTVDLRKFEEEIREVMQSLEAAIAHGTDKSKPLFRIMNLLADTNGHLANRYTKQDVFVDKCDGLNLLTKLVDVAEENVQRLFCRTLSVLFFDPRHTKRLHDSPIVTYVPTLLKSSSRQVIIMAGTAMCNFGQDPGNADSTTG